MISLKKLDGTTMYLNEDHVERVETGAKDQSAVYLSGGSHIISATSVLEVVERIRAEKATLLHRALTGPVYTAPDDPDAPDAPGVTRLNRVRG